MGDDEVGVDGVVRLGLVGRDARRPQIRPGARVEGCRARDPDGGSLRAKRADRVVEVVDAVDEVDVRCLGFLSGS